MAIHKTRQVAAARAYVREFAEQMLTAPEGAELEARLEDRMFADACIEGFLSNLSFSELGMVVGSGLSLASSRLDGTPLAAAAPSREPWLGAWHEDGRQLLHRAAKAAFYAVLVDLVKERAHVST